MPQYLYKLQPVRREMLLGESTDDEQRITGDHFQYLKRLTEEGVIIHAGRTTDTGYDSFGIVIFNADDDTAAHAIMQNDPAVANRIMRAELHPYGIALLNADNAAPQPT